MTDALEECRLTQSRRYERVKAVQKTGETTRDMWHKADWDKVKENPESVQFPREDWIHTHDADKHAEDVFDESFSAVKTGEKVVPEKLVSGPEKGQNTIAVVNEVSVNGTH